MLFDIWQTLATLTTLAEHAGLAVVLAQCLPSTLESCHTTCLLFCPVSPDGSSAQSHADRVVASCENNLNWAAIEASTSESSRSTLIRLRLWLRGSHPDMVA